MQPEPALRPDGPAAAREGSPFPSPTTPLLRLAVFDEAADSQQRDLQLGL